MRLCARAGLALLALGLGAPALAGERAVQRDAPAVPTVERQGRVALVIGNDRYKHTQPLSAAVYDAELVAQALEESGFEVTLLRDADLREMELAVARFTVDLKAAEVGLLYYAGHGVQIQGRNYLIPVDADITHPEYVGALSLEVQDELITPMHSAGAPLNLVILDACRNNPFARSWVSSGRDLAGPGLGTVSAAPGFVIAYATSPDNVALDGGKEPDGSLSHGPYADALVAEIREPGNELQDALHGVYDRVRGATEGMQTPWTSQALGDVDFYFSGTAPQGSELGTLVGVVPPEPEGPPDTGWRPTAGIWPGALPSTVGAWTVSFATSGIYSNESLEEDWSAVGGSVQANWAASPRHSLGASAFGGLGLPARGPALGGNLWSRSLFLDREHTRLSVGALLSAYSVQASLGPAVRELEAGTYLGADLGGEALRVDLTIPLALYHLVDSEQLKQRWFPQSLLPVLPYLEYGLRWRVYDDLTLRAGTYGCFACFTVSGRYRLERVALQADLGRMALTDKVTYLRLGAEMSF